MAATSTPPYSPIPPDGFAEQYQNIRNQSQSLIVFKPFVEQNQRTSKHLNVQTEQTNGNHNVAEQLHEPVVIGSSSSDETLDHTGMHIQYSFSGRQINTQHNMDAQYFYDRSSYPSFMVSQFHSLRMPHPLLRMEGNSRHTSNTGNGANTGDRSNTYNGSNTRDRSDTLHESNIGDGANIHGRSIEYNPRDRYNPRGRYNQRGKYNPHHGYNPRRGYNPSSRYNPRITYNLRDRYDLHNRYNPCDRYTSHDWHNLPDRASERQRYSGIPLFRRHVQQNMDYRIYVAPLCEPAPPNELRQFSTTHWPQLSVPPMVPFDVPNNILRQVVPLETLEHYNQREITAEQENFAIQFQSTYMNDVLRSNTHAQISFDPTQHSFANQRYENQEPAAIPMQPNMQYVYLRDYCYACRSHHLPCSTT